MKKFLPVICLCLLAVQGAIAQSQVCPLNSNWSFGNLTHWWAYTGNNAGGNPASTIQNYDSSLGAPSGTQGVSTIYEYNLPSVPGIQILTANGTDPFGFFSTIPKINGYQYSQTIKLGSTSITRSNSNGTAGGYVRGVSYKINVPPGLPTVPYTMTYAYAMVLENGAHNSNEQPLFTATLKTHDSVITCASPSYYLPTLNNATRGGGGATLDSAAARANGFFPSSTPSPNPNPNGVGIGADQHLYDVWYKGWTEVTFDLGPFRGQQVTLTFETDNCVPGGHFAYSYIALRNTCAGLQISGDTVACIGSTLMYSVPALAGATYQWSVPGDWSVVSGTDSNILKVTIGNDAGQVTAHEQNSCANLQAILPVTTSPPTIAGALAGGSEVCTGSNSTVLTLGGNRGSVLNWLSSTDGIHFTAIADTLPTYTAVNLTTTTSYRALVQNGESCLIDTASAQTVLVDPLTVGGSLSPSSMQFCLDQTKDALLSLVGAVGKPVNWQSSPDALTWTDFLPANTATTYEVPATLATMQDFRVEVQSGVCPPKYSAPAKVTVVPAEFPQATTEPADTIICYNTAATLNASILLGTSYTWNLVSTLTNQGDGSIGELPFTIQATAKPPATSDYVITIENAGCPNALKDTFHVRVLPPIIVDAGNDTSIVVNQPLQLLATSNDTTSPAGDNFLWTPGTGLNNAQIADPVALFSQGMDSVRYFVTAISKYGCTGTASIVVKIFSTGPDIFVPNAFTPGGPTNNLFRPVPVGIKSLSYFRVFSRWGQQVFSTSQIGQGWDGMVNGQPMPSGAYVWVVQGTTYMGKVVFRRGTMILVR